MVEVECLLLSALMHGVKAHLESCTYCGKLGYHIVDINACNATYSRGLALSLHLLQRQVHSCVALSCSVYGTWSAIEGQKAHSIAYLYHGAYIRPNRSPDQ